MAISKNMILKIKKKRKQYIETSHLEDKNTEKK